MAVIDRISNYLNINIRQADYRQGLIANLADFVVFFLNKKIQNELTTKKSKIYEGLRTILGQIPGWPLAVMLLIK